MKNKLNKILLITSTILVIVILILALFASINREGYLSNFQLNKDLSKKNAYYYDFRLKYYSKIFRNSDIYGVVFDIPQFAYVGKNLIEFKNITFDKKGSSPFCNFISTRELQYDDKIQGINYKLKLKIPIWLVFIIVVTYILFNYKLIIDIFKEKKEIIIKVSKISSVSILAILVLLFILGQLNHKASLEDLELIAESEAGYVYRARVVGKGLFSDNVIYKYNSKLQLKNKPDYIKNYGYNANLKLVNHKNKNGSIYNNPDKTVTISNNNNYYSILGYDIEPSVGEKYIFTLEAKKIGDVSGNIKYQLDDINQNIVVSSTDKMTDEYKEYTSTLYIKDAKKSIKPVIRLHYPVGTINVKYLNIQQVSDNLYLKSGNTIIFTSSKKINDKILTGNIIFKLNPNNIFIFILIISIIYLLKNVIDFCINKIIDIINYFGIYLNKSFYDNIIINQNTHNEKTNCIIYILFLLFPIISLTYISIAKSIPYYYWIDSTEFFGRDILLSYLGIPPGHLLYPNMIPLILYKYIFLPIGYFFNIISSVDLTNFQNSLNPYLYLIEIIEYVRNINILILLIFMILMYINFIKIFNIEKITNNKLFIYIYYLSLFIISCMSSFIASPIIYQMIIIRYDTIGLLLISISLYFTILSSETNTCYDRKHILYIILSSICAGGAVLSKLQFGSWMICIFIIYIILNINKFYNKDLININFKKTSYIISLFTIIFIFINIIVYNLFVNKKIIETIWLNRINPEIVLYILTSISVFFIALSVLAILIAYNKIKANEYIKIFFNNAIYYIVFSFSPMILSLLLPKGIDMLCNAWIFTYGGGNILAALTYNIRYIKEAQKILMLLVISGIFSISIIILSIRFYKKIINKILSNIVLIRTLLSILLIIISFIFIKALRSESTIKDAIISYTILYASILIVFRNIILYLKYDKIKNTLIIIFIIISSIISLKYIINIHNNNIAYASHHKNDNESYYNLEHWKQRGINGWIGNYKDSYIMGNLFTNRYSNAEIWNGVFFWSRNIQNTKKLLKQVIVNNNNVYNTSVAEKGALINRTADYISQVDNNIKGGIILPVYNAATVYVRSDYDFYFISNIEYNDKNLKLTNYNFYVNNSKYFVYLIKSDVKLTNFGNGFILINDKLVKKL